MNGDAIDDSIIDLIKKNENISNAEISKLLGIPEYDVVQRIQRISDTRSKILLVDDEIDTLLPLKRSLELDDFIVVGACNGGEALIKAKTDLPDLIILDLMMPEMDGYEVCKRLKNNEMTRNIPVIILTARDAISDKIKGLEIGADDYVTKPFHLNELKARVKSAIRRSKNQY